MSDSVAFLSSNDDKLRVREANDIVDVLGSYMQLRRQGRNFVSLCPWHDDSRPSLQINQERQSWKCWVCNDGGDVFSFVMKKEGLDFRGTLELLAQRAGIELTKQKAGPAAKPGSPDDKKTLLDACQWAAEQFEHCFHKSPVAEAARKYIAERGINEQCVNLYRLGFAPNDWQWLTDRALKASFSPQVLDAVGLAQLSDKSKKYYDRFRGRVIFPIRDPQGRVIAFGGRILPEFADERSAKYYNSPETRLFSKSEQLYGLDLAKESLGKDRHLIVMEGYTDVIMARQFGVNNATAVLGTALTERHIPLIKRYADRVTLLLDGDEAGRRRSNEILELFIAEQMDLRILTLPDDLDPCDFLLQRGGPAMQELMPTAVDALEHKIRVATAGVDLVRDTHRANEALEDILQTMAKAPQGKTITIAARKLREHQIIRRLARSFYLTDDDVRERLSSIRRTIIAKQSERPYSASPAKPANVRNQPPLDPNAILAGEAYSDENMDAEPADDAPPRAQIEQAPAPFIPSNDPWEREILEILTQHPHLATLARDAVLPEQFSPGPIRVLFEVYCSFAEHDEYPDFTRIMSELEDNRLKNLLVDIDEAARSKGTLDPEARIAHIASHFHQRLQKKEAQAMVASLEQKQLDEQDELRVLEQLLEQARRRQGI